MKLLNIGIRHLMREMEEMAGAAGFPEVDGRSAKSLTWRNGALHNHTACQGLRPQGRGAEGSVVVERMPGAPARIPQADDEDRGMAGRQGPRRFRMELTA